MAPTAGCSRTKAAAGNIPRSGLWVSSSCICLVMARSRSDLDNEMDHEIRRLTFPTSRRLAARSGIEPNLDARRLKGREDALCRIGILRGVAEEDPPPVCAPTRFSESTPIPGPLVVLCRAENAQRSQSGKR